MIQDPFCYFNGETKRYSTLHLHVSDLQFQRSFGVFDFFRIRNGDIPWLDDYTDRFFNSMRLSEIGPLVSRQEFTALVHDLHRKNGLDNGAFKVIATGGYSDTLDSVTGPPNLLMLNLPWQSTAEGSVMVSLDHLHVRCRRHFAPGDGYVLN